MLKKLVNSSDEESDFFLNSSVRSWREEDGIIYFSFTSNGKTGQEWLDYFETKKIVVGNWDRQLLLSPDFQSTNDVTTEIAVLKGMLFTDDDDHITKNIRAEADQHGWLKPNAEVACLIRDLFTDKELEAMGLYWIVVTHEPIKDSGGDTGLLSALRGGCGGLRACCDEPGSGWPRGFGFAFAISQVSLAS